LVVRVAPKDYWFETAPLSPSYWQDSVELAEVDGFSDVPSALGPLGRVAYVGNEPAAAAALGVPAELVEPDPLMRPLDWHRAVKTDHEVALIEAACREAAEGQRVARKAFEAGRSEREIFFAYLEASRQLESEAPFVPIVALDEKSAVLHYQNKRAAPDGPGRVFLLDAGAECDGYASDITRTWCSPAADPMFHQIVEGVDALQRELVELVTPGRPYPEINEETHRLATRLLVDAGVVKADPERALALGISRTFLPHGVGHHLGIQVHDVGGRQAGPDGGEVAPPDSDPFLRNTRTLQAGHVVTIEPGVYFIPMLLEPLRQGSDAGLIDWGLVDRLVPCGGVRIEDDIVCTPEGPRDLTRPLLAGPRGI
ncbi:MAG: Xaa-Pro dipeptidase, partial [Acidobacteriota bacterium]|nr:Xaa-Pro dipeptidase [Acidobacteriota bacterium]